LHFLWTQVRKENETASSHDGNFTVFIGLIMLFAADCLRISVSGRNQAIIRPFNLKNNNL
jgi:hypothetical protein